MDKNLLFSTRDFWPSTSTYDLDNYTNSNYKRQLHLGNEFHGPLEIPGGGWKFPKKIRAKKNAWKKIRAAITSEKKIRASKQQSTNSLEKKFVQRLNALKTNPAETWDWKKIRAPKVEK
jgi:hypothetical protein